MTYTLLPLLSLTKRELTRFYRQRSRIIGSLATPIIFWILLGTGLQASATGSSRSFLTYFFPANLVMTLLFTSIFSTISIIEDRNEGFLQAVLVAPVSRVALVGGKVLGGALIGTFQGLLFLCLAPLAGYQMVLASWCLAIPAMFALSLTMTALGFLFAWKINSVQGFHSIMNLVLFPMWLMSGTFFKLESAPQWLKPVMYLNPLTYGVAALNDALEFSRGLAPTIPFLVGVLVTAIFGMIFYWISMRFVAGRTEMTV